MKNCKDTNGRGHFKNMLPSLSDMDEIRVWKLTFFCEDGSSVVYNGEYAFWGTGEQARNVCEFVAKRRLLGKKIKSWETERVE